MGNIALFSCSGGDGIVGNNVALMFAKKTNSKVVACVGKVSFTKVFGKYYARSSPKKLGVWKYFYYENGKAKWSLQSYLSWIGGDFE